MGIGAALPGPGLAAALDVTARQAENLAGHAVPLVTDFPATHATSWQG